MSKPISRIQRPIATATITMIITDATEIEIKLKNDRLVWLSMRIEFKWSICTFLEITYNWKLNCATACNCRPDIALKIEKCNSFFFWGGAFFFFFFFFFLQNMTQNKMFWVSNSFWVLKYMYFWIKSIHYHHLLQLTDCPS